ncbi:MAG TPA: bifunctional 2-polyprenyl-6-hydroxyphenol methylase/3-demethylubiquinol 3-O-methyltransferase UbiG, partial [Ardenticatenaceae bacterium]|nr:bifunctional 2-polyprenyl-6-hydroxyphenol methylase/3-demethylubiquinol 3-O-methyltransferase UbiG [Ardenticatenaceae bacterium]
SLLAGLTPARMAYMRGVLVGKLQLDLAEKAVLDLGCGGGRVAEEMARLGCHVLGIDPSARSIATARAHAKKAGLDIDYQVAMGEALPLPNGAFDIVYSLDVLEHVVDLDRVMAEIARVLLPGGVFIYDTINQTMASNLVVIKLMQDWSWTSVLPQGFHDWRGFIKPGALVAVMARHGLENREIVGFGMRGNWAKLIRLLWQRKQGKISYGDVGRFMAEQVRIGNNSSVLYGGYAVKTQYCSNAPSPGRGVVGSRTEGSVY